MSSIPVCRYHPEVSEGVRHCVRCGMTYCGNCLVDINGLPHCSVCKNEQLLDIKSGVDLTTLPLAGIGKRFLAMFLDNLIIFVPIYLAFIAVLFGLGVFDGPGTQPSPWILLIYIPLFTVPVLYEGLMTSYTNGQTVGKKAVKTRIVRPDGSPISKGQAWGRALMRLVLGCVWIVDYVPAFFTKERTTLHDLIAGTRVVQID